jgi:hypothetical protein
MLTVVYALVSSKKLTVLVPYIDELNGVIFNVVIVIAVDEAIGGIE